jgi:hypothetical protein
VLFASVAGGTLLLAGGAYAFLSDPFAAKTPAASSDDAFGLPGPGGGATTPPPVDGPRPPVEPTSPPKGATPDVAAPPTDSHPSPPPDVKPPPPDVTVPPVHADPPKLAGPRKGAGVLAQSEGKNVLPVPAAATGQGILSVTASPWGVVWVDGKEIGETPRELRVGEGYYRVKIAHPTLGTKQTSVTVAAGRRAAYHVAF